MSSSQCAAAIWMVRPSRFAGNEETRTTNRFQNTDEYTEGLSVHQQALKEFDHAVNQLRAVGIHVVVSQSKDDYAPDSVFPNNWISFHHDGHVIIYPMLAVSRRRERDLTLLDELLRTYKQEQQTDISSLEAQNIFLEGTGSIVFDHKYKIAYASLSERTHADAVDHLCKRLGYTKQTFTATDKQGFPVYHTNVVMHIGEEYAVVCTDSISDTEERETVISLLTKSGRDVITISPEQMEKFAGNMLQVYADDKYFTVMSTTAYSSLLQDQIDRISHNNHILQLDVSTIEHYGGGSIRCMMAEIFLPRNDE